VSVARTFLLRAVGLGVIASGCATGSAAGVPDLDPERIYEPKLSRLSNRELDVSVVDAREPRPERAAETVHELQGTVEAVCRRGGMVVSEQAENSLSAVIRYMDEPLAGLEREDCVELELILKLANGGWVKTVGGGCFSYKHWLGFRIADDPNTVYETALNTALKQLDRSLAAAP
jgi:hypothetical protein